MDIQDTALIAAGVIGSVVAVIHGVLTQRLMVRPFDALARTDRRIAAPIRRLVPLMLHFSTVSWFLGGLALIGSVWMEPDIRLTVCVVVAAMYLYGALGNLWGTRSFHPGWMLYAVALVLIGYSILG